MQNKPHHVMPNDQGGWDVWCESSPRAQRHFQHKDYAIDYARALSRNLGIEIYIHDADGKVWKDSVPLLR